MNHLFEDNLGVLRLFDPEPVVAGVLVDPRPGALEWTSGSKHHTPKPLMVKKITTFLISFFYIFYCFKSD